ncbi:MAG TPA: MoaD/ThiS family protein [Longimicrobiaceae bacterium]|nr:MoaD/ThiS family protein [Longimicrobiaceae bacterium]
MTTIRVELPVHLRTLARVEGELRVEVADAPTVESVLDSLEARYPMLRGTIREHGTNRRRAFIRYFAAGEDVSFKPPDAPLPAAVASGADVLRVLGAIAGG